MKARSPKTRLEAFTIWDLLIVLVTVALVLFTLPLAVPGRRTARKTQRIHCVSNLKQVGLAFRMWSGDHGEKFPMTVSTNDGGSLEFVGTSEVYRHFLAISNEVNSPKVLACPTDTNRKYATGFVFFNNKNLSYFVGLDAAVTHPQMILSGDRNLSTNGLIMSGILTLTSNSPVSWTKDMHAFVGNVGLGDGSVQQVTGSALSSIVASGTNLPERLAIP